MHAEIIIAGFGGQGALFAGQMLAYAAMDEGRHVTWIPSYGPEMRGGTAHCTVIISDDEIGSPLVAAPSALIAMNQPSLEKYAPYMAAGGLLVAGLIPGQPVPAFPGLRVIALQAAAEAERLGSPRSANMILLGALLAALPVLPPAALPVLPPAALPVLPPAALPVLPMAALPVLPMAALERALAAHQPLHHADRLESNLAALRRGAVLALAPAAAAGVLQPA